MKTIKQLFLEKLHLGADSDNHIETKEIKLNTPKEVADFIHGAVPGSKVKQVLDHGYSSASFKNWGDHGAYAYCKDVWTVEMPDKKYKIRIGLCTSTSKIYDRSEGKNSNGEEYISGINKGDICFNTGYKRKQISGRESFTWEWDALTGYEPGTDLRRYIEIGYTGNNLKRIFKEYKIIDDE